jgi:PST family polysaccharide transporter
MTRHRDFKMVKKILLLAMPPITLFCAVCFIWAEPVCSLLLGEDFAPAGQVLRAMLPAAVLTLPNYILSFPTLGPMGLSSWANYSVMIGSCVHLVNLVILYFTGNMNMISLAAMLSVTEAIILVIRIVVIVKHRDKMRPLPQKENGET